MNDDTTSTQAAPPPGAELTALEALLDQSEQAIRAGQGPVSIVLETRDPATGGWAPSGTYAAGRFEPAQLAPGHVYRARVRFANGQWGRQATFPGPLAPPAPAPTLAPIAPPPAPAAPAAGEAALLAMLRAADERAARAEQRAHELMLRMLDRAAQAPAAAPSTNPADVLKLADQLASRYAGQPSAEQDDGDEDDPIANAVRGIAQGIAAAFAAPKTTTATGATAPRRVPNYAAPAQPAPQPAPQPPATNPTSAEAAPSPATSPASIVPASIVLEPKRPPLATTGEALDAIAEAQGYDQAGPLPVARALAMLHQCATARVDQRSACRMVCDRYYAAFADVPDEDLPDIEAEAHRVISNPLAASVVYARAQQLEAAGVLPAFGADYVGRVFRATVGALANDKAQADAEQQAQPEQDAEQPEPFDDSTGPMEAQPAPTQEGRQ